jgi:hypothetical protein
LRAVVSFAVYAGAFSVAAASLGGQSAPPRGSLDGVVTDTALTPLAGATAWILGTKLEVSTGANGRFRITEIPPGTYILVIRRLGYEQLTSTLALIPGDTVRAFFTLLPQEVALSPVVVKATAPGPLSEFESRRASGLGQFMTQAEIEKLNMAGTSDLLRTFQSVTVGDAKVIARRMAPAMSCPMQFYVDGVPLTVGSVERDLPSPREIAGIEVHANAATVPMQYASLGGGMSGRGGGVCGVILIWTRR